MTEALFFTEKLRLAFSFLEAFYLFKFFIETRDDRTYPPSIEAAQGCTKDVRLFAEQDINEKKGK